MRAPGRRQNGQALIRRLYSLGFTLAFLLALPYFLLQALRHRKYLSSLSERLGILAREIGTGPGDGIWVHAVSVGEVLSALPLIKQIERRWPGRPVFLSTTSRTGQELARKNRQGLAGVFYFPLDWKFAVRRSLDQVRPGLVLILETEIWPNFLHECRQRGIPVCLANGRISDRSFRKYRRFRRWLSWAVSLFDCCCMQDPVDRERIVYLGAPPNKVEVCGNLKYEIEPPRHLHSRLARFRSLMQLSSTPFLVVAGSTRSNEEAPVLRAFRSLQGECPQARLLLAPRHPERCAEVEQLLTSRSFRFVKRSELSDMVIPNDGSPPPEVILLDTLGELPVLYALADLVFVGGSLIPWGGHNLLEPALFKKAVLFGPNMNNFREMARHFMQAEAGIMVQNEVELGERFIELFRDGASRRRLGANGYGIIQANQGAGARILDRVASVLSEK
ncbi:MAG: 3-deoxy-D-manno-octulosonic acid transferase [Acidobacteria bacterium]|nr:3-deoxy-D-manno-octulosonic acid transferase [Acidobacteriota bacterium]